MSATFEASDAMGGDVHGFTVNKHGLHHPNFEKLWNLGQ